MLKHDNSYLPNKSLRPLRLCGESLAAPVMLSSLPPPTNLCASVVKSAGRALCGSAVNPSRRRC